ncbi:MAG TPA: c-type cytochrome [Cyclobacteriaceae bacterium]|nr:c-type cytochrome [Cyclobacteriaceae bacterium]
MRKSSFILIVAILFACEKTYRDEIYTKPEIVANPVIKDLSPEESLKTMYVPKGYKIQLVASEPLINEPVTVAWDGNGKMYVAQMMTYMQDIDAGDENAPWSRVSVLEDTNNDGVMDKSTTFVDSLVLPRIILPLDDRVIIGETFERNLYSYRDTNGDNIADEKILLLEDTVRDNRNLEHQDANMLWSIDNWLYVTNKTFRYRFTQNKFVRDTLPEPCVGQWGLTQDETGRLFFSRAGAEIPANGFQQHPAYGNVDLPGQWDEVFMEPWPIVGTPDAQGGPRRIREGENTLNRFTGVAGQEIYLGDKMQPALGDLFIPEPVGRLVRRAKVRHNAGKIFLENAYDSAEFLASTDPLFRPVHATTGPDGCLYVVDMYRGIIQEGTWVGEGSYLRGVVQEKGYDKFTSRGRIYKIIHEEESPGPNPDLLSKSAKELTEYLGHPNGWWRNTAQKLIVLKNDPSVAPGLVDMIEGNGPALERLHALWTLEGLDAISKDIVKTALKDKDARVRAAAIRISDRYVKAGDNDIVESLKPLASDPDFEVLQQLILTFRIQNNTTKAIVKTIADKYPDNEVIRVTAGENLNPSFDVIQGLREKYKFRGGDAAGQIVHGYKIFQEYCSTCHGKDAMGISQLGPPLVGSARVKDDVEVMAKILLHGLEGPIDGKTYNGPMVPVAQENDEYIADIISYVREELNGAGTVWRGRIRGIRERTKEKKGYYTLKEIEKERPKK